MSKINVASRAITSMLKTTIPDEEMGRFTSLNDEEVATGCGKEVGTE